MVSPKMKRKMEIPGNKQEKILFHNDQKITASGSEAFRYAIQGPRVIGLLNLA